MESGKSNIKIFVSHRIDIESEVINNPLYIPVRCGAVFDTKNPMNILGDDTGDNISERRMTFCEFTVQYWAWKNVEADYYGLCHYRRFLSFSDKRFKTDEFNMIHYPFLTSKEKRQLGLLNEQRMREIITACDVVTSEYALVSKIPSPNGRVHSVRELWEAHDGIFIEKSTIDLMFTLIDELSPEYSRSAREYFAGGLHRGFNCFVMRKELFDRLCRFQFPIMFELENRLDFSGYTQTMKRTPGFVGEMLYGIFLYHISNYENWKIHETQLAFFVNADRIKSNTGYQRKRIAYVLDRAARFLIDPVMPKGTKRRETLKKIIFTLTPLKPRGVAVIQEFESIISASNNNS